MPRPEIYVDEAVVCLNVKKKKKLKGQSMRRAIVNKVVDHGGCVTLKQLDIDFDCSVRKDVAGLVRLGWLELRS